MPESVQHPFPLEVVYSLDGPRPVTAHHRLGEPPSSISTFTRNITQEPDQIPLYPNSPFRLQSRGYDLTISGKTREINFLLYPDLTPRFVSAIKAHLARLSPPAQQERVADLMEKFPIWHYSSQGGLMIAQQDSFWQEDDFGGDLEETGPATHIVESVIDRLTLSFPGTAGEKVAIWASFRFGPPSPSEALKRLEKTLRRGIRDEHQLRTIVNYQIITTPEVPS